LLQLVVVAVVQMYQVSWAEVAVRLDIETTLQ
jgi:hypothetical protein